MESKINLLRQERVRLVAKNNKKVLQTELKVLRKLNFMIERITELETENAELRKENTVIPDLRNKISVFDAEITELKCRNTEVLRANGEYNERHDIKIKKLEQNNAELEVRLAVVEQSVAMNGQPQNDKEVISEILPEISTPNNNTDIKLSKDKKTDFFLDEVHKEKVSNEIRQKNREKKLLCKLSTKDLKLNNSIDEIMIKEKIGMKKSQRTDLRIKLYTNINFLFYQNMEEFLLTKESLNIIRISTALFVQVEQGEWMGILKKKLGTKIELNNINVENLGFDHPICLEVLNIKSEPFTNIPGLFCDIFKELFQKYKLDQNHVILDACKDFIQKEESNINEDEDLDNINYRK
ncbi:hypothetical protein C1645_840322 [Glomus cerebriforme]|uniref:Uncharacterized protein n=1 Tax=Glomus cerebriforme TaxID=658196 RepID=A0A397SA50_9GLOM|nr:hypothetical protein C1645_840322 [Glomus cerebriforme]